MKKQPAHSLPSVIQPAGLDSKRQWYLYEQIRPFCKPLTEDLICPLPLVPKPNAKGMIMLCVRIVLPYKIALTWVL